VWRSGLWGAKASVSLHHELDIKRAVLYRWRDVYRKQGMAGFERPRAVRRAGSCAWAGDGSGRSRHQTASRSWNARSASNAGSGFFAKSLQAFKGNSPEEYRNWRESIYAEIGSMMQFVFST